MFVVKFKFTQEGNFYVNTFLKWHYEYQHNFKQLKLIHSVRQKTINLAPIETVMMLVQTTKYIFFYKRETFTYC
jgi:hypothetical protein